MVWQGHFASRFAMSDVILSVCVTVLYFVDDHTLSYLQSTICHWFRYHCLQLKSLLYAGNQRWKHQPRKNVRTNKLTKVCSYVDKVVGEELVECYDVLTQKDEDICVVFGFNLGCAWCYNGENNFDSASQSSQCCLQPL